MEKAKINLDNDTDLLPCPGCGGEAKVVREAFYEIVRCTGCGLKIDPVAACATSWEEAKHDREHLIRKWNNLPRRKSWQPSTRDVIGDATIWLEDIQRESLSLQAYIAKLESGIYDLYKMLRT